MNPLGVQPNRFVVATANSGETVVGWGQIKSLGPALADSKTYDARRGSGSIESNVDEDLWLEFESSSVEFPNGRKSLPWTPEYKAAAEEARERRERRDVMVSKERMDAANGSGQLWELASMYVMPEYRSRGIGSDIVQQLLEQHVQLGRARSDVYALTLRKTVGWYNKLGFEVVEAEEGIPQPMMVEVGLGRMITRMLGEELVCLRAR